MKRTNLLPYLPLLLAPLLLLSPVLFTGHVAFWGTTSLQFLPWRYLAWETLQAGHLPLWNPDVGMGAPLAANYQSALFYPPNWMLFLLAEVFGMGGMAWGQGLLVALHLVWASVGMAKLGGDLGFNRLAQTVSGLAFGLSGYLVARSGFLSINAAAAWLPWIILGAGRLSGWRPAPGTSAVSHKGGVDRGRLNDIKVLGPFLGLAVCLAMQLLAGHAQTAWYTLLLAGMWAAWAGWHTQFEQQDGLARGWWLRLAACARAWARLGLAGLVAAALAAVQLAPTAEYLLQSTRAAEVGYDFAMTYSFWPWRLLTLFAPDLFGNPAQGDYWGYGNYWEDAVYVGVLPLLLALGTVIKRRNRQPGRKQHGSATSRPQAPVFFLAALLLASFLLALGKNTPLFPWLYRNIPTFAMFQAPTRFTLWAVFALALLAGAGVSAWQRPQGRALYWTRLGTAGAFAITLGAFLTSATLKNVSPTFIHAAVLAGLWSMGTGLLSLFAPLGLPVPDPDVSARAVRGRPGILSVAWPWVVVVFVAADLLVAGWGLNPGVDPALFTQPAPIRPELGEGRLYLPEADEYELKFRRFMQFDSFDPGEEWIRLRAVFLPNLGLLDGLPTANNFDPLFPARYGRWMEALADADAGKADQMLNLMGVSMVEKVDSTSEFGVRFEPVEGSARVHWASCARPARDVEDAWRLLGDRLSYLDREVVVEGLAAGHPQLCRDDGPYGQFEAPAAAASIEDGPDRLAIQVQAEADGWLVLSDTWYPGWQARIDGVEAHIYPANTLFRAVFLPAGRHEVVFEYRPLSFYLGSLVSLLAWIGLAATMLAAARQMRLVPAGMRVYR